MPTPNLGIAHIAASQNQKEVTANDAFDRLDEAMNDTAPVDCSAGNTSVDGATFTRNFELVLTGTPAAAFTLSVPDGKRFFLVRNATAQVATVQRASGGGSVNLTAGQRRLLYNTGTEILAAAPDAAVTGGGGSGGASGAGFRGAVVKLSADASIANQAQTAVGWATTLFDTDGFWSGGNPTRLTVPAGVSKVVVVAGVQWGASATGDRWIEVHRNGVEVEGLPGSLIGPLGSSSRARQAVVSAPIQVSPGDYFELVVWQNSGGALAVEADPQSWFAVMAVDTIAQASEARAVQVKRSTDQAVATSSMTAVAWEAAEFDDGAMWSGGSPTRLTVPAGVSKVRLSANLRFATTSSAGYRFVRITRNGASFAGRAEDLDTVPTNGDNALSVTTGIVPVQPGDYFELECWQNSGGSLGVAAGDATWFNMEVVERVAPAFRGALVNLTATEPVPNSTDTALAWDAVVYDTDGFWSAGNPTRLTLPAGVTKVRLKGNISWGFGGAGYRHVWANKNGALFPGAAKESDEGDSGVQNFGCAVVPVVAGDYFEFFARQTSGSTKNVLAAADTWFAIEVVE